MGQLVTALDGTVVEANEALASMMGASRPEELVGFQPWRLLLREYVDQLAELTHELITGGVDHFEFEPRVRRLDGELRWFHVTATLIREPDGTPRSFLALVQDTTERRTAEERLSHLANIVESTSDLVGSADLRTGRLIYLNRAARELFGVGEKEVPRVHLLRIYTRDALHVWEHEIAPHLRAGRSWTGELPMRTAEGRVIQVLQTVTGEVDPDGTPVRSWSVGRDITERKLREEQLAHRALHDELTGLPNRALLLDRLEQALARSRRSGDPVAVLFLDLDRFKNVNDEYGHAAGDDLLAAVAHRLRSVVRPSDTVARLGGDEFVVVCEAVDETKALDLAQRLLATLEDEPFRVARNRLRVTASIGVATAVDPTSTHPEALLRDADAAMYRAKDLGRARIERFDDELRRKTLRRTKLADDLRSAVERGEIVPYYQPIVDIRSGEITGVEALARWQHPTRGLLTPGEFMEVAEETGLIVGLGVSILTRACDQLRRWQVEFGSRALKVHVNLSARQLAHRSLPTLVETAAENALVEPELLCLEITESVIMEDAERSVEVCHSLKRLGVELAVDDFGTGYSSLAYLKRLPVDVLKIDKAFVEDLTPDSRDSSVAMAIISLAHTLGLRCVAEGVENVEQLTALRGLECDEAQGFLIARPLPAEQLTPLLGKPLF
ncbi:MAG: bifunctional diguanylate cyclase/phosphodiesterase [Acidimicrobiales bacterium]|nr:MAG: bifunctional diguanylate cyclase/phosphodiesterase [Acidimicrobiales bacterium]